MAKGTGGLVLTRADGQKVMVGPDIEVQVVWAANGQCQLRFVAPGLRVWREELLPADRLERRRMLTADLSHDIGGES